MPEGLITATGQTIAAVQLDEEEMEKYKDIPVSFNFDGSGFYSFPVGCFFEL
jgi:sarcosine oxidase/L-pipecolate oxidase